MVFDPPAEILWPIPNLYDAAIVPVYAMAKREEIAAAESSHPHFRAVESLMPLRASTESIVWHLESCQTWP